MKASKQPFEFLTHLDHEGAAENPPVQVQQAQQAQPLPPRQRQLLQQQQSRVQQQSSPVRKERSVESDSDENESGGVFAMTGIGEEIAENTHKEKPKTRNTTTLRSKLFATLNLSAYTSAMAEENGPLKPGYVFYELLSHSHGLKVPIPDTFVIDKDARISHICNDKYGNIQRVAPDESSLEWKEEFVTQFVNRCVQDSVPVGLTSDAHSGSIGQRPVGMLKRPAWRKTVRNSSETLTPLALQAHMLDCLEPCNVILQKFIKSKGRKASITRMFWKLPTGGGSKSVVGWSISNVEDFAAPPVSAYARASNIAASAAIDKKKKGAGNNSGKSHVPTPNATELALEDELALSQLKNSLFMGPSDRAQVKVKDSKDFSKFGHFNVCSLTNTDGVVTNTEMDKVSPFKMSPKTTEDPEVYTERIVAFLQKYAETREGLLVHVTEIVCDFIKDDDDKWWFIQIKGLRLCRRSRQQIHRWILRKADDDDSDFEDEGKESFQEQYKRKIREAREKVKENMDNQCKMCGIFYTEGEMISQTQLKTFDTTEDEERRLEKKLLSQQKAEHLNLLHYQEQMSREQMEFDEQNNANANTLPPTTARHSLRTNTAMSLPTSPETKKSLHKSPLKSPVSKAPTVKPHRNPSFKELKGETDLNAIAAEEGVNVDLVPAYGYQITYKMAILLTEMFRNNNMFLTKYCHDLLINEAQYNPSIVAGGSKGGSTLRMGHNEKRPDAHVTCCRRCFYVLESHFEHKEAALRLYEVLGLTKEVPVDKEDEENADDCSAAELFRLNTGRSLSVKRKKGGKNGKTRVISTTSIVEAAATKLTDMHNSKQSAGASKSKDLSMSSSLNPQHKSSPTPVIEKDFLYKGTRYPFTSQHFKSDTKQWRLIFLFHNFLDVECNEGHPLYGAYGCMTYSLGQHTQSVSFRNTHFEAEDAAQTQYTQTGAAETSSRCIWIRQCRLHYMFASQKAAMHSFSQKRVEFHLFFTPDDKNVAPGQQELRWEGSFHIDLNKLLFSMSTLGDDKFDVFVPVSTQTMGNLIAKISVSVAMSSQYSDDVHTLQFHKEKDIFWPPTSYVDHDVLPDAWLSMMTRTQTNSKQSRDKNQNKLTVEKFKSYIIDDQDLAKCVAICKKAFDKEFVMSDGTANCTDVLNQIVDEGEHEGSGEGAGFGPLLRALELMLEDGVHMPARLRFDDLMRLIIYQVEQWMEDECVVELPQTGVGGRRARTQSTEDVQTKSKKRDVARLSNRLSTIVGVNFQNALANLSISTRGQGAEAGTKSLSQEHTESNNINEEEDEGVGQNAVVMDAYMNHKTRSTRRLSKMASSVYAHVLQDSCKGGHTQILELAQCAPSRSRRHRRGLVLMTIFEAVAKHADMMDIAELKQFLVEEKEKLMSMVSLMAHARMRLPAVKHRFDHHLRDHFSLLRSVICCLLLESSHLLQEKFDEYDSNGIGAITELGFLTVCESCFREVSQCLDECMFSETIRELKREGEKAFVHSYESEKINNSAFQDQVRGGGDLMTLMEDKEERSVHSGGGSGNGSGSHNSNEYEFDEQDEDVETSEVSSPPFHKNITHAHAHASVTGSQDARRARASVHQSVIAKHQGRRNTIGKDLRSEQDEGTARVKKTLKEANFEETPVAIWMQCDLHGYGYFFLADLCCIKCETEVYQPLDSVV